MPSGSNPDIADIETALACESWRLRFAPALERLYLKSYLGQRAPMVPLWASIGTLLYCLAYLGDQTMMAPNADLLFWLRFGVFLPYGISVIVLMRYFPSAQLYEALTIGVGILGALLPMSVLAITDSPYALAYQYGTISTLLFMVVLLRPRFYAVLVGCVGILAIQLTTTAMNGGFDDVTYSGIVTLYLTFTVFLVLSAYAMERTARRMFLQSLHTEELTARLRHQSTHDDLSGLKNRRALTTRLEQLWTQPNIAPLSAVMLDIDHFKLYNDTHGHMAGDNSIRIVSQIVQDTLTGRGEAYRYGGEEMLVLLPATPLSEAARLAEAMRLAILEAALPHFESGDPLQVITASFGVAEIDPASAPAMTLLSDADDALYQAKRMGRNCVYPAPAMTQPAAEATATGQDA